MVKDKTIMEKDDFIKAGFTESDDPQFKFEYPLSDSKDENFAGDPMPAILFDIVLHQFCVTDGEVMFIYFNADNPAEAVEWANKITHFDEN